MSGSLVTAICSILLMVSINVCEKLWVNVVLLTFINMCHPQFGCPTTTCEVSRRIHRVPRLKVSGACTERKWQSMQFPKCMIPKWKCNYRPPKFTSVTNPNLPPTPSPVITSPVQLSTANSLRKTCTALSLYTSPVSRYRLLLALSPTSYSSNLSTRPSDSLISRRSSSWQPRICSIPPRSCSAFGTLAPAVTHCY